MNRVLRTVCTLLLSTISITSVADDYLEARTLVETGAILPLAKILEQVKKEHPGRILDVELEREQGRYIYEIELVDKRGHVWELEYDATSGTLIEKELED